jgi:hypothetical protein
MLLYISLPIWPNINTCAEVERERFSALQEITQSKRLANCALQLRLPMLTSPKCSFLLTIIIRLRKKRMALKSMAA